jgi:hypothetical protein
MKQGYKEVRTQGKRRKITQRTLRTQSSQRRVQKEAPDSIGGSYEKSGRLGRRHLQMQSQKKEGQAEARPYANRGRKRGARCIVPLHNRTETER